MAEKKKMGRPKKNSLATSSSNRSLEYKKTWEDALPDLISKNVSLQKRALGIVEAKLDDCTAKEAATIYGILHDKCATLIGPNTKETKTFNMYFGDIENNDKDMANVMESVLSRIKKEAVEVESTSV